MSTDIVEVPARSGRAVKVAEGESVKLINTLGSQVVDVFAFNAADLSEYMSMEHTRVMLGKLSPKKGDALYSNRRRALLTLTEDTSPGTHDTLRAACDPLRYRLLGCEDHASCTGNLAQALLALGLEAPHSPCPLNMFENCTVATDLTLTVMPPPVKAGEFVVLRAEVDSVIVFSACPMDIFPTNGPDCTPKPVAYQKIA